MLGISTGNIQRSRSLVGEIHLRGRYGIAMYTEIKPITQRNGVQFCVHDCWKRRLIQARINPLHRIKVKKEPDTEANVTVPKKSGPSDARFEWGINFVSINCNLTAADVSSERCIYDTGAGANVANRFQRKLIRKFRQGNVIGAGGRVVGVIGGEDTIVALGQKMPVYYGPDLPKSVFSIVTLVLRCGSRGAYV